MRPLELYLLLCDEDFKKEVEKSRPKHIPKDFYYGVYKCLRMNEDKLKDNPDDKESTCLIKYLKNLISENKDLKEKFYNKASQNHDFLAEIFANFLDIALFKEDPHKTTQGEDNIVIESLVRCFKKLELALGKCPKRLKTELDKHPGKHSYVRDEILQISFAKILRDYFRNNLWVQLQRDCNSLSEEASNQENKNTQEFSDEKNRKIQEYKNLVSHLSLEGPHTDPVFLNISLSDVLKKLIEVLENARKSKHSKYPTKKIFIKNAPRNHLIPILKKTMENYSIPSRSHVSWILILIFNVMGDENISEDFIRDALKE